MGETATDRHPTREEWAARKAALPSGVRAAVEERERRDGEAREARRKADTARLDAKVDQVLTAAGAAWLLAYRDRSRGTDWEARFDPTGAGLWPVTVRPWDISHWLVEQPTGLRSAGTWPEALALMAEYVGTPF